MNLTLNGSARPSEGGYVLCENCNVELLDFKQNRAMATFLRELFEEYERHLPLCSHNPGPPTDLEDK